MVRNPHLTYDLDIVPITTLCDFDTMMLSVVPYKFFKKFIINDYPDHFVYLQMYAVTTELKVLKMQLMNEEIVNDGLSLKELKKRIQKLRDEAETLYTSHRAKF